MEWSATIIRKTVLSVSNVSPPKKSSLIWDYIEKQCFCAFDVMCMIILSIISPMYSAWGENQQTRLIYEGATTRPLYTKQDFYYILKEKHISLWALEKSYIRRE